MSNKTDMTKILEIESLTKTFDGKQLVLDGCGFELSKGSICAVVGESGSGKTTLLRLIAGLERPNGGVIRIDGDVVSDDSVIVPPRERNVGFVFQDFALFPHLTVEQNIAFGIQGEKKTRVLELLDLIEMEGFEKKYPNTLSGGQKQRVALARTLALKPELLLLDEPFSNLDASLRSGLRQEVRKIVKTVGTSMIFITHDLADATDIADEIVFLKEGKVLGHSLVEDFRKNIQGKEFDELINELVNDAERILQVFGNE